MFLLESIVLLIFQSWIIGVSILINILIFINFLFGGEILTNFEKNCDKILSFTLILQCRLKSTRLPSKALKEIDGYPMIVFIQKRLSLLKDKIDNLVLAIPEDEYDVFKDLLQPGFSLVTGDHEDVLSRFGRAFELFPADYMIRTTADNPFVSIKVISDNIDLLKNNFQSVSKLQLYDYLTRENLPIGVQTEFIKNNAFWKAFEKSDKSYHREHVTPYIYENPDIFNIGKVPFPGFELISDVRLTVDTTEDYSLILGIIEEYKKKSGNESGFTNVERNLDKNSLNNNSCEGNLDDSVLKIDLDDILTIYKKNKSIFRINQDIIQKNYKE